MNIPVKCYINVRMTKDLAEALNIKANLNTPSSKCMSRCMEVGISYFRFCNIPFESPLHNTRFNIFACGSGQNISFRLCHKAFCQLHDEQR